jgi:hypothetical protein
MRSLTVNRLIFVAAWLNQVSRIFPKKEKREK